MPLILGANSVSGYTVKNSLRFNSGSSDYLSRTYGTPTNNLKYTKSFWIKRSGLTDIAKGFVWCNTTNSNTDYFYFDAADKILIGNGTTPETSAVFRDVSAWYHCVMVFDSANATAANRLILYINNVQQTLSSTITLNSTGGNQSGVTYTIGYQGGTARYLDAYMSEIYMIDGQALTPSSFGETDTVSGIWIPKAYTGTYGTNGFCLQFKNSASLGTDSSGNGNTFTVNNLTSIDQTTDTPTNNFCTLNPLYYGVNRTITEGNLKVVGTTTAWSNGGQGTIGVTAGKWYFEGKVGGADGDTGYGFGWSDQAVTYTSGINSASKKAYNRQHRAFYNNNSGTDPYFNTVSTGDILMCAFDADNGKIWFGVNGTWQNSNGTATNTTYNSTTLNSSYPDATGITVDTTGAGVWTPSSAVYNDGQVEWNFGNPPYSANSYTDSAGFGNFSYSVPSGFFSLNTKNLAQYG